MPATDKDAISFSASSPRIPLARTVPTCGRRQLSQAARAGLAGVMANAFALILCILAAGVTAGFLVKSRALTLQLGRRG